MSDVTYRLPRRARFGIAWRALWPVMVVVLLLIAFALWKDARWPTQWVSTTNKPSPDLLAAIKAGRVPNRTGWIDWCILFGIAWFLMFKANVMARRLQLRPFDYFAVSLILINLVFATLYELVLGAGLFPYWVATHPDAVLWITNGFRAALMVTLACSAGFLLAIPEPDRVRWRWVHERLGPILVVLSAGLVALTAWAG